jgi:hypothetical protein
MRNIVSRELINRVTKSENRNAFFPSMNKCNEFSNETRSRGGGGDKGERAQAVMAWDFFPSSFTHVNLELARGHGSIGRDDDSLCLLVRVRRIVVVVVGQYSSSTTSSSQAVMDAAAAPKQQVCQRDE